MTPAAKLRTYLRRRVRELGGEARGYMSPGHTGVADQLVFLPGGRILLVEIKAGRDTIKPLQRREAEVMGRLGFITRFVRNKEDIDEVLS